MCVLFVRSVAGVCVCKLFLQLLVCVCVSGVCVCCLFVFWCVCELLVCVCACLFSVGVFVLFVRFLVCV